MSLCGTPPTIEGGYVYQMNDTGVRYKCGNGYGLTGYDVILCINNQWQITNNNLPTCLIQHNSTTEEDNYSVYHIARHEIPEWLLYIYAVLTVWLALTFLVCIVLILTTVFWRCTGQSLDFDGTHVYPEGRMCKYCCRCFRLTKSAKKKITRANRVLRVTKKLTKDKRVRSAVAKIGRQTSRTILPSAPLVYDNESDVNDPGGATKTGFHVAEDDESLIIEDVDTTSLPDVDLPNGDQSIRNPNGKALEPITENVTSELSESKKTQKTNKHMAAFVPIQSEKSTVSQKNVIITIVDTENEDIDDTAQLLPSVPSTTVVNETASKDKNSKGSRKKKK